MQNAERGRRIKRGIEIAGIALFCALILLLDFITLPVFKDEFRRLTFTKIVQQTCGSVIAICCLLRFGIRLFGKPKKVLYLIPCLLIAIDNFQWSAFLQGKMELVRTNGLDWLLFALRCGLTGLFEELIFRGILFAVLAGVFKTDKRGFLLTYLCSSLLFGVSHILNGLSVATLLQVGYSCLTGGLFAFCLIKTKNILCVALVHGVYNFCGMLYDVQGLGTGVVFDFGTVITMLVVSIAIGILVLYKVWTYPDEERRELYALLGVKNIEIDTEDKQ